MRVQLVCCDVCSRFTLALRTNADGVVIECRNCGAVYDGKYKLTHDPRTVQSEARAQ
jgi:uncharacterized Zn finger protein